MYGYLYLGIVYNFYAIEFLLYEKHGMLHHTVNIVWKMRLG